MKKSLTQNQWTFILRQKDLLQLGNTPEGKWLIGAGKDENIVQIFHNGYSVNPGGKTLIGRFSTHSTMEEIFIPLLAKFQIQNEEKIIEDYYEAFLHYTNIHRKPDKYASIYLDINTFTANGGGQGRVGGSNVTYSTIHDSTSETASSAVTRPTNATGFEIQRGFAPFDTLGIGAGATVLETVNTFIRCLVTGTDDNDSDSVSVVESTQASDTALVGTDFDNVGTTKFVSDVAISAITTTGAPGSANDFQLNAAGVAHVKVAAYSLFAWRTKEDISNTAPTVGNNNIQMVDDTNFLSVEFTPASGSAASFIGGGFW